MAGARTFEELDAWKLANELRQCIGPVLARVLELRDVKLHEQMLNAARSGPSNIAEGFARYQHRDFAKFVRIARASEVELLNHLHEAHHCKYLTSNEFAQIEQTARRAIKAASGLIKYLEATPRFR